MEIEPYAESTTAERNLSRDARPLPYSHIISQGKIPKGHLTKGR